MNKISNMPNTSNRNKDAKSGRIHMWVMRFMALVAACVLWVYVMNEQNPITTKMFRVPLNAVNLAEDMVVKDLPETVDVKVSGTRSQIAILRDGDIKAYIDFTDAPRGRNTYNVLATVRMGEVAEITPSLLQLETDALAEKTMPIEPRIVGVPNSGVTVSQMDMQPKHVLIKGPSNRIAQVDKVLVMVDISHHDKNFTTEATAVAMDKTGREMYDVKVEPTKVKTAVTIVRQLGTNDFPIKANMSGKLPAGITIKNVKITPATVRLTAEPKVLGGITQILTAPIVLNNLTSNVELKMPLQIPDQVLADQHNAIVEITLETQPAATAGQSGMGQKQPQNQSQPQEGATNADTLTSQ